nr:hypothetical protein [Tessaracoccus coleopterorum]
MTNFGTGPFAFGEGEVLLASSPVKDGVLPGATTVWLRVQN